ncbi:LMF2 [Symbiodinium microadriaticum]|nr:LMF2 [Symbiodinium microadriaticum]
MKTTRWFAKAAAAAASGKPISQLTVEEALQNLTRDSSHRGSAADFSQSEQDYDSIVARFDNDVDYTVRSSANGFDREFLRIEAGLLSTVNDDPFVVMWSGVAYSARIRPVLEDAMSWEPTELLSGLKDTFFLRHGSRGPYWAAELAALLGMCASGAATAIPVGTPAPSAIQTSVDPEHYPPFWFPVGMTYLAMEGSMGAAAYALNAPNLASWFWRWCLFRGLLSGGVHKLLLCDASWNNLSAVHWHFQGNPNPSALSWYAFQLTSTYPFLGHMATASTLAIELVAPFLFFSPNRGLRMLGLAGSSLLQLGILASSLLSFEQPGFPALHECGNYGPLNFYFLALGLSLLQSRRQLTNAPREEEEAAPCQALETQKALLSSVAGLQGLISLTSGLEFDARPN